MIKTFRPQRAVPGFSAGHNLSRMFYITTRRLGVRFTRNLFHVNIPRQQMTHFRWSAPAASDGNARLFPGYFPLQRFRISTSRFGIGHAAGSNCTPLGLHRIKEKIGGGWPVGTVFKGRRAIGFTWKGLPFSTITSRILWLEGLEPGFNRGGNVDSHARYIYIHGTGNEPGLGRPASCGCVHLAADDLLPLFDQIPGGTLVWITNTF